MGRHCAVTHQRSHSIPRVNLYVEDILGEIIRFPEDLVGMLGPVRHKIRGFTVITRPFCSIVRDQDELLRVRTGADTVLETRIQHRGGYRGHIAPTAKCVPFGWY